MLKARKLNGAFWNFLKRFFGSLNCLENVETKEAKWAFERFSKNVVDDLQGNLVCSKSGIRRTYPPEYRLNSPASKT